MNEQEQFKKRVIEGCNKYKEIGPLDDGYQYFWIKNRGALSSQCLRIIADELDRLNADWDKVVQSQAAKDFLSE